ncbi:hypothetical protein ACOME3_003717 [Neoechinorhynchus agilis]
MTLSSREDSSGSAPILTEDSQKELDMLLNDLKAVCERASTSKQCAVPSSKTSMVHSARLVASLDELDRLLRELQAHRTKHEDKNAVNGVKGMAQLIAVDESINTIDQLYTSTDDHVIRRERLSNDGFPGGIDEATQELENLMQSMSELRIRRAMAYMHTPGVNEADAKRILNSFQENDQKYRAHNEPEVCVIEHD